MTAIWCRAKWLIVVERPNQVVFYISKQLHWYTLIFTFLDIKHKLTHWGRVEHVCLTEICSFGSNWWYGRTGSDNGLALSRQQAIIWTNDGKLYWCIYAPIGLNVLSQAYLDIEVNEVIFMEKHKTLEYLSHQCLCVNFGEIFLWDNLVM